jgi:serine/threonine-protein kinase
MSQELQPGEVLDGRLHVTGVIARRTATRLQATDLKTGRTVALKVPFLQFESDPSFFARFEREEVIARGLDHPYVLKIIPVENKSRPYIALEYPEGQTLARLLHRVHPLPAADALRIAGRICQALEYLHGQDVVHRDLKPDNVVLCNDGSIRILDFGIAKAAGKRRITFTDASSAPGTPDYMAPEQVRGKRGDPRTDLYSLGAILYEMVTGSTPFVGEPRRSSCTAGTSRPPARVRGAGPSSMSSCRWSGRLRNPRRRRSARRRTREGFACSPGATRAAGVEREQPGTHAPPAPGNPRGTPAAAASKRQSPANDKR